MKWYAAKAHTHSMEHEAHVEGLLEHPLPRLRGLRLRTEHPPRIRRCQQAAGPNGGGVGLRPARRGLAASRQRPRRGLLARNGASAAASTASKHGRGLRRLSKRPRRSFIHLHMKLCFANAVRPRGHGVNGHQRPRGIDQGLRSRHREPASRGSNVPARGEAAPPARRA